MAARVSLVVGVGGDSSGVRVAVFNASAVIGTICSCAVGVSSGRVSDVGVNVAVTAPDGLIVVGSGGSAAGTSASVGKVGLSAATDRFAGAGACGVSTLLANSQTTTSPIAPRAIQTATRRGDRAGLTGVFGSAPGYGGGSEEGGWYLGQ